MISLDSVCEDYVSKAPYPIDFITDAGSCWAIFSAAQGDDFGAWIPLVDKETGSVRLDFFADHMFLPRVPIDEKYRIPRHEHVSG